MTKIEVEAIHHVDQELVITFTVYEGEFAVKTKYRATIPLKNLEKVEAK